eukprot:CAMPEP_0175081524 /NCGR_PEP_ID=MMETSP0052_2-20121109/26201_1 /TAXON_ID=51329 ORGANISM="Polytomella parva, Strain SAG 63-3" /NCGR_SAMPLE_ID=MMETSP0052_2 /ASSEMBLY_ACC=CAM_ASM_000194 /LENGTH=316 /DNA_ID=CAMNT_0016352525 /DNA_START=82 /DNA_END=1029 /DNA_ORIENTATION=-
MRSNKGSRGSGNNGNNSGNNSNSSNNSNNSNDNSNNSNSNNNGSNLDEDGNGNDLIIDGSGGGKDEDVMKEGGDEGDDLDGPSQVLTAHAVRSTQLPISWIMAVANANILKGLAAAAMEEAEEEKEEQDEKEEKEEQGEKEEKEEKEEKKEGSGRETKKQLVIGGAGHTNKDRGLERKLENRSMRRKSGACSTTNDKGLAIFSRKVESLPWVHLLGRLKDSRLSSSRRLLPVLRGPIPLPPLSHPPPSPPGFKWRALYEGLKEEIQRERVEGDRGVIEAQKDSTRMLSLASLSDLRIVLPSHSTLLMGPLEMRGGG